LDSTFELVINNGNSALAERSPMNAGRLGFGCCVDNYGDRIFAVGGSTGKHLPTNLCEVYDIRADKWSKLPNLSEPRFSESLCIFNDEWLFAIGGFDGNHSLTSKIERLSITEDSKEGWETLDVTLPVKLSSPGTF
jgi:hypothetical protein